MFDINTLTADDWAQLKQKLDGMTDVSGRSPIRPRQLNDLRLLPTKDDPRPTFFWSAESPRETGDLTRTTLYPRLMWHGRNGAEITVRDAAAQVTATASGYILMPPENAAAPEPYDVVAEALASLSEKDRAALSRSYQQARMEKIQAQLAALPEDQIAELLAMAERKKEIAS